MASKNRKQPKGHAKRNASRVRKDDLVITRTFDAPRERVWEAWTEPNVFKRWWGPKNFTIPFCKIDFTVGGRYYYCMRSPDGKDFWATGVYREIVPIEKIVCTDSFADEEGNVVPGTHYGMKGMPLELLVTVTFEDVKGKTKMTLIHAGLPAGPNRKGANQGWNESFDKLAEEFEGKASDTQFLVERRKKQLVMTRVFDAPCESVFRAYTDPKLIPQWWGRRDYTTIVDEMQVKKGGRWRYVQRTKDGEEYGFRGEYREVVAPARLVSTFEFEGMPGRIVVDAAEFQDIGRKTKVTVTSSFDSVADLEGMLKSGMEEGARETWDRLGELLAKTAAKKRA